MMGVDDLRAWSLTITLDTGGDTLLSRCGLMAVEKQWSRIGYLRDWEVGEGSPRWILVQQYSVEFNRAGRVLPASEVVAEIRRVTTCETYDSREGEPRLTGEIELPEFAGVEASFGFCERIDRGRGKEYQACSAFLAREEVVSKVRVRTSEGASASARELIPQLARVAAEALAKA